MRQTIGLVFLVFSQLGWPALHSQGAEPAGEVVGAAEPNTASAEYGEMVRRSPWRAPQDELAGFHLPPGFEVRLFASEPQIAKPLNLAVDNSGRVWMTQTTAYPKPAEGGTSPTDAVMILEDTNQDGHADRITTFASGLNIPIGVFPYGEGCICFSIPNIYYLRDTDGDGVCDQRDVLLGPFDTTRDTHGMVNALRDGGDGWIYACHGFNNRSVVAGTDGHEVRLESGNTFRFRPDGSRIEQLTQGQVNPFGMTRDEWGYWYSADCHSKPITQLIRGACYPSFGRPDDGLGFLPPTVDHLHGSTAISGILAIASDSAIVPLRGQIISGNVMTSRLNRNRLSYHGATARGTELPDFLTSDDSWFRPVDIQIDTSNNIYVADFYNKIIGHYEVPLDHPDRDRTSGRVWQIRYVGGRDNTPPAKERFRETRQDASLRPSLVEQIDSDNVHDQITAIGKAAESRQWSRELRESIASRLDHDNAHVVRAASEAIGRIDTDDDDTRKLIAKLPSVDQDDVVLRQTIRIAIRNRLLRRDRQSPIWNELITTDMPADQSAEVASILLAVDGGRVVAPLVRYLSDGRGGSTRRDLIRHAAIHADEAHLESVVKLARELTRDSVEEQERLLDSLLVAQTRFQSGARAGGSLRQWALDLASDSLDRFWGANSKGATLVGWSTSDGKPWQPEQRKLERGGDGLLPSSFSRGETYTGVLQSDPFPAPKTISFYLAGHSGRPDKKDHGKNMVRLVRVADGTVLHETRPPRNDTAKWITWTCDGEPAELVRIEAHDGDDGNAYAWLAIGQFDPPWLDQTASPVHLQTAISWASRLKLTELIEPFEAILIEERISIPLRVETALAIAAIEQKADWQAILTACKDRPKLSILSAEILALFAMRDLVPRSDDPTDKTAERQIDVVREAIRKIASYLSVKDENAFTQQWVRTGGTSHRLLDACEAGWLNPAVLAETNVTEVLRARVNDDESKRLQKLVAGITPRSVDDDRKHQELVRAITVAQADAVKGAEVFTRNCAACHQLRGTGAVVGPQLDGVLSRSDERLVEDILMPDRNVDAAFRTTSFLMDDGRVIVGMVQAEDDKEIKLADQSGKILQIETDTIETRIDSNRSLMPSNFAETLSATDLANLFLFMRKP